MKSRAFRGETRLKKSILLSVLLLFMCLCIPQNSYSIAKGYTLSGYISADIAGETNPASISKEGFTVEISDSSYTAKTDANGYFKIENIVLGNLNTTIRIKKPGYLKREITNVMINSNLYAGTVDKPILLWPGDVEGSLIQDNVINMVDIMELAKYFNSMKGDSRYNSQLDFNIDSTINMADIFIVARNFNKTTMDYPMCTVTKPDEKVRYLDEVFSAYTLVRDIEFKEALNYQGVKEKLLLDVYSPDGDTEKSRPVILHVHSGGLSMGSKEEDILSSALVRKGYVAVNINYRLNPDPYINWNGTMRNAMEDVVSAIDWVKTNSDKYGMDKNNIILTGYSAGAEIITNLVYGTYVDGWDRNGISGVVDIAGNRLFWGGALQSATPCLIIHGTADDINPYSDVLKLVDQFNAGGIRYELVPFEGEGHYFRNYPDSHDKVIKSATEFLYKNVIPKQN